LAAQQPKSSKTDLASLVSLTVLLALPLVVRFGRSAAQILQNGPRQLGQVGCAPAQQPKSFKTDRLLGCAPCSPSAGSAAQILQNGPRQLRLPGCAPCSPSGGPFEPLSSPNPSKRTCPTLPLAVDAGQGPTFNLQVKGLALTELDIPGIQELI